MHRINVVTLCTTLYPRLYFMSKFDSDMINDTIGMVEHLNTMQVTSLSHCCSSHDIVGEIAAAG